MIISAVRRSVITIGALQRAVELGDRFGGRAVGRAQHDAVGLQEVVRPPSPRAGTRDSRPPRSARRLPLPRRGSPPTQSPVPIGMVLLLTTIVRRPGQVPADRRARRRARSSCRPRRASPDGVLTQMKTNSALGDRLGVVGGEARAGRPSGCARRSPPAPARRSGSSPARAAPRLRGVDVDADHLVAELGEERPGHQPDVARTRSPRFSPCPPHVVPGL